MEYDPSFSEAIQKAYSDGEFSIPCASHDEAKVLRGSFYAFRFNLRTRNAEEKDIANALTFTVSGSVLTLRRSVPIGTESLRKALHSDTESKTV